MAKKSMIAKAKRKPRFERPRLQPLLRLWPAACLHASLRAMPHLLPGARPAGRAAGRHQVELVAMNISDPIADMLTRIRNASRGAPHGGARPGLADEAEIARILKDEGFIDDVAEEQDGPGNTSRSSCKYVDGKVPVVSGLKRISKPGLRVYAGKTDIPRVLAASASSSSAPARGS